MSSLEDLARRVQRLEDIDEIKCVKARYCAACDRGYDADAIAALYSVDGVWDGGRTFGKVVGREKIRKFFVGASQRVLIARHQVMNPDIEIDPSGKTAKGTWLLFQPCTDATEGAAWLAATYYDKYVKVGASWLIAETIIDVAFFSPASEGWAKQRFLKGREPERFVGGDWSKL